MDHVQTPLSYLHLHVLSSNRSKEIMLLLLEEKMTSKNCTWRIDTGFSMTSAIVHTSSGAISCATSRTMLEAAYLDTFCDVLNHPSLGSNPTIKRLLKGAENDAVDEMKEIFTDLQIEANKVGVVLPPISSSWYMEVPGSIATKRRRIG